MRIRNTADHDVLLKDNEGHCLRMGDVKQLDKDPKKIVRIRPAEQAAVLDLYYRYKAEKGGGKSMSLGLF